MAPLIRAFRARQDLPDVALVHTGQDYGVEMNERLFADLELPSPDINLEAGSGTHAVQTAEIMRRFEPVIDDLAPSCVVVVGDVNSTLACSIVAPRSAHQLARRSGFAQFRSWHARGNQPPPDGSDRRPALHQRTCRQRQSRA
jgi:UDP-N-acetylglucosamine 2-epimerase (non-hydrolysing)